MAKLEAGSVAINIIGNTTNFVNSITGLNQVVNNLGIQSMPGFKGMLAMIRDASLTITNVGGLISDYIINPIRDSIDEFTSYGDSFSKLAQRTGMSANFLSRIGYAAEQSDASLEDLSAATRNFARVSGAAARGEKAGVDAFKIANVDFNSIKDLSKEDQFLKIIESINAIPDATARADAAMKVFGKGGTKLLPLIAEGTDGIQALMNEADEFGISISNEDAANATIFGDMIDKMNKSLRGLKFTIIGAIAPALTALSNIAAHAFSAVGRLVSSFVELIPTIRNNVANLPILIGGFFGLSNVVSSAISPISSFVTTLSSMIMGGNIIGAFNYLKLNILLLAESVKVSLFNFFAPLYESISPLINSIVEISVMAWNTIAQAAVSVGSYLYSIWETIGSYLSSLWESTGLSMSEFWTAITSDLSLTIVGAWWGIASGINSVISAIQQVWNNLITYLMYSWFETSKRIAQAVGWIISKITGLNSEELIAQIGAEYDAHITGIISRGNDQSNAIETARNSYQQSLDNSAQDTIANVERSRTIQSPTNSRIDQLNSEIAALKQPAIAGENATAKLDELNQVKNDELQKAAKITKNEEQKISTGSNGKAGTFSAYEMGSLGGNVVTDILKSQKLLQIINNQLLEKIAVASEEGITFA
jgi:hypothetical protein